jgi:hypothetical protein
MGEVMLRILLAFVLALAACVPARAVFEGEIYVLQGIDKDNVSDSSLREADGFSIRFSWASVDKGTSYDFRWLDSQIARAKKLNKPYMLRMMAGTKSPGWIKGAWYKDAPLPWNTTAQASLASMVRRLGERYSGDPNLYLVHLSSTANYESAEMHFADGITKIKGYTNQKMIDAWGSAITAYAGAFPGKYVALNASWEPPGGNGEVTLAVVDKCQRTLGGRAAFQHNSLKADTSPTAKHHKLILDLQRLGWMTGFQMACPSSNRDRFGGAFSEIFGIPGVDKAKYLEIYQGDL